MFQRAFGELCIWLEVFRGVEGHKALSILHVFVGNLALLVIDLCSTVKFFQGISVKQHIIHSLLYSIFVIGHLKNVHI